MELRRTVVLPALARTSFVVFAAAFIHLAQAHAATVLVGDRNADLWRVDTITQDASLVGRMAEVMTDVAISPTGELFGITFTDLYRIDPVTANTNHVGSLGLGLFGDANALEFDTVGNLYLATISGELREVDTITGVTSLVMNVAPSSGDLGFAPDGTLLLASRNAQSVNDDLVLIDLPGGTYTTLGSIGFPEVFGLAFSDGMLFGFNDVGEVFSIDVSTGAGTLLGDTNPLVPAFGAAILSPGPLVGIDPGHGQIWRGGVLVYQRNPSAVYGVIEDVIVLEMSQRIRDLLSRVGFRVLLSREGALDRFVPPVAHPVPWTPV